MINFNKFSNHILHDNISARKKLSKKIRIIYGGKRDERN